MGLDIGFENKQKEEIAYARKQPEIPFWLALSMVCRKQEIELLEDMINAYDGFEIVTEMEEVSSFDTYANRLRECSPITINSVMASIDLLRSVEFTREDGSNFKKIMWVKPNIKITGFFGGDVDYERTQEFIQEYDVEISRAFDKEDTLTAIFSG